MSRHRHSLLGGTTNQISVWGVVLQGPAAPVTFTPPANMKVGDLVYVYVTAGGGGLRDLTITNTGGQTWTNVKIRDGNVSGLPTICEAVCIFNGTWTANPVFSISGSVVSKLYLMQVIRPPVPGGTWTTDQFFHGANTGGGSGLYTMPEITNTVDKPNITIFNLQNAGVYTSGPTAAYWRRMGFFEQGGANARNLNTLYQIQGFVNPVGATGNVAIDCESSTTAQLTRHSWYYTAP